MDAAAFQHAPVNERYGRLLSCSLPCERLSIAGFLAAAESQPRFYWSSPTSDMAFAGAGAAVELMAWGADRYHKIASEARALFVDARVEGGAPPWTGPRLIGGFAFRGDFTPDNTWSIYAPACFALPHYQLARARGRQWLTINAQIPPEESPSQQMPALRAALTAKIARLQTDERSMTESRQSPLIAVDYPMSRAAWARMINDAVGRIRAGELQKIVLARAAELRFGERVRPLPILRHLAANYADCYRFLIEMRPGYAFYGASPELLAATHDRQLDTMALAGSAARGDTQTTDRRLGAKLLASAKERQEHDIVVEKMRGRLQPMTESLEVSPARLLKLRNIQHIHTPIRGLLKRQTGILPLTRALHPTPALGGHPRAEAMRLIRELEPIPRGWYGAPVGWIDSRLDGQFAVAIRSAVAQEARAWIYAGAGIVAESVAEEEWAESELKFRPMLEAHHAV